MLAIKKLRKPIRFLQYGIIGQRTLALVDVSRR